MLKIPTTAPTSISDEQIPEKVRLRYAFFIPAMFVLLLWVIEFAQVTFEFRLTFLGVHPRDWFGLIGLVTAPLVHSGWEHLISNSVPLLLLWAGVLYFYRTIAYKVFFLVYLLSGLGVWIFGRESYHIGASGVIYGLVVFLFFSGIIRNHPRLMAISMLVTVFYGSMVWGILPLDNGTSWEAHLAGALVGFVAAIFYRREGPQKPVYDWMEEEEEDELEDGMKPPAYIPPAFRHYYDLPEEKEQPEVPTRDPRIPPQLRYWYKRPK